MFNFCIFNLFFIFFFTIMKYFCFCNGKKNSVNTQKNYVLIYDVVNILVPSGKITSSPTSVRVTVRGRIKGINIS